MGRAALERAEGRGSGLGDNGQGTDRGTGESQRIDGVEGLELECRLGDVGDAEELEMRTDHSSGGPGVKEHCLKEELKCLSI